MKKNIKLLIGSITLGLMVAVGVGATASQVTKASDNNVSLTKISEAENFELDESGFTPAQWMQGLIDNGLIDKRFEELTLKYFNAKTEDEKQAADKKIMDYLISNNWMTIE